jgi:hypothetical protein
MVAVGTTGAISRWLGSHQVGLTFIKRSQLEHVGFIIYRVCQPRLGNVDGVTGQAEDRAGAYEQAI